MDTTAQNSAEERKSRRQETGRFRPHSFSKHVQRRFDRERRREYLDLMSGRSPSLSEAALLDSLIRLEWNALKAEAEGTMRSDREAREHRRLYHKLLEDFGRTLGPAPKASTPSPIAQGRAMMALPSASVSVPAESVEPELPFKGLAGL